MEADAKAAPGEKTASGLSSMRAAWIVETGRCDVVPPPSAAAARDDFVRGLCARAARDQAGAKAALDALSGSASAADEGHAHGGAAMAYGRGGPAVGNVMRLELEALLALDRGDQAGAVRLAGEAAAAEDAMSFEFGPPAVVKPAHELSGEILLAAAKPADARREFEASLAHNPGRSLSLQGLARAAEASGDAALAAETRARLRAQWKNADPDVPGRAEVLAGAK